MIKGLKKSLKINQEFLLKILESLKLYDKLFKTNLSKEFYLIFIDEKIYTINNIALLTNYSNSTIKRHIKMFMEFIN